MNMTRVIGPALAGLLIVFIDTSGVFYLISVSYLFSLLTMILVHAPTKIEKGSATGIAADISTGLRYVANDPALKGIVITLFIPIFFGFSLMFLLPAWGREVMDMQPEGIGFLMMIMGSGSLSGTLVLAAIRSFNKRGIWLLLIGIFWGFFISLFSLSVTYITALPFLFLAGFMSGIFMALHTTLMQVYSNEEMRGRIMSIAMMSFGATPLSILPFGAIAEKIGTPITLSLSGLLMICFVIIFLFAYPAFRKVE
jgi:predicted MFS family arabinose efflux permease